MKQQKMIDELMYRIDRYRSMGNGAMAQALCKQLRALNAQVNENQTKKRQLLNKNSPIFRTP